METREIHTGKWWRPGAADSPLHGTMFFEAGRGWLLRLIGTFGHVGNSIPIGLPASEPMLLGELSTGSRVTAIACIPISATPSLPWQTGHCEFFPDYLAYDIHFDGPEDFVFTELSARYSNMDQWVGASGFQITLPTDGTKRFTLDYLLPGSIESALPDSLQFRIRFEAKGPDLAGTTSGIQMTQQSWLSIVSPAPRPFGELLSTLSAISDLVSLGIGQPVRLIEFAGMCLVRDQEGKEVLAKSKLVPNREPVAAVRPDVHPAMMLFRLADLALNLTPALGAWLEDTATTGPLRNLYFGTLRPSSLYLDHRFLNMFQALESFDRRRHPPDPAEKANFDAEKALILGKLDSDEQRWLKKNIREDRMAAAQRLERVVSEHSAGWIFEGTEHGIAIAAVFRNFHTHFDPKMECRLPPKPIRTKVLYNLSVRLQLLCEVVLINSLGLANETMTNRLRVRLNDRLASMHIPEFGAFDGGDD